MASIGSAVEKLQTDIGALVAEHRGRRGLQDFARYANDPIGFFRDVLKWTPWSRQEEIALLVRDHPLVSVLSCNSAGKDAVAAHLALWWVFARRGLVLISGPTERQCREILMGEIRRAFGRAKDLPGKLYEMALRLDGDEQTGILAYTSTEASRLTGFHAPNVLCILTESQALEGFSWEAALACATGADSRILAVGNPLHNAGKLFETARSPAWASLKIPATDHPNIIARREVIRGGPTIEWVERMAAEYGRESSIYRSRVLGEFPDDSLESLCKRSWLDAAADRWESGALEERAWRQSWTAALDPARFGLDKTSLAARQGPIVRKLVTWGQQDTMTTVGLLLTQLREWGAPTFTGQAGAWHEQQQRNGFAAAGGRTGLIRIDEIGLGAGILDRLREQGYPVEGFNSSRAPSAPADHDLYFNARAQAYFSLRQQLEAGTLALPRDEQLFEELTATQWKPSSTGRIQIESKDDLKARLGRSPDRADAVAMCCLDLAAPRGVRFESVRVRMG